MDNPFFWLIIFLPVFAAIGYGIQAASLQNKFAKLGNISGCSRNEIVSAVGQPNSVSTVGPNQTLLQWQTTGYHIALRFTGDVCDGITHEYRAK